MSDRIRVLAFYDHKIRAWAAIGIDVFFGAQHSTLPGLLRAVARSVDACREIRRRRLQPSATFPPPAAAFHADELVYDYAEPGIVLPLLAGRTEVRLVPTDWLERAP